MKIFNTELEIKCSSIRVVWKCNL